LPFCLTKIIISVKGFTLVWCLTDFAAGFSTVSGPLRNGTRPDLSDNGLVCFAKFIHTGFKIYDL